MTRFRLAPLETAAIYLGAVFTCGGVVAMAVLS